VKKGPIHMLIVALAGVLVLVGLAMWTANLKANTYVATGELDWRFVPGTVIQLDPCDPSTYDWNATFLPIPGAIQLDKDVGCTSIILIDSDGDGDLDTMEVTLINVYPWYYNHIAFKVHNDGTIPLKIWRVIIDSEEYYEINRHELQQGVELDLNDDSEPDVLIWWGDNFGVQLEPCQSADISFDITVLQTAPQGATLHFTISLDAIAWNEYYVPSGP